MIRTSTSSVVALFMSLIVSCGGDGNSHDQKAITPPNGIVGVWEKVSEAGGAGDIIELRDDGTYALYEDDPIDSGVYSVDESLLTLEGSRYALGGWRQAFEIKKDKLTLTNTWDPGDREAVVETTEWRYTGAAPILPTTIVDGQQIVSGLPLYARAALSLARDINIERELVRIDLEELAPGAFAVNFYTTAPNQSGAHVQFRPFHVTAKSFDKVGWGMSPLPVDFIDLPEAVEKARASGFVGQLTKAELLTPRRRGPVWRVYSMAGAVEVDAVADTTSVNRDWAPLLSQYASAFGSASKASPSCAPHEAESGDVCALRLDWLRCRAEGGGYRDCL